MDHPSSGGFWARIGRRALTIPGMLLAGLVCTMCLPVLVPSLALYDLATRGLRQRPLLRLLLLVHGALVIEAFGLLTLGVVIAVTAFSPTRRVESTYAVQKRYVRAYVWLMTWVYDLRFELEGEGLVTPGPLLVFSRHASLLDVMLPGAFLHYERGLRLRYVLKKELLLQPCLDVAGHILPIWFVARGGVDTEREAAGIADLKRGLGATDAVLIFPEGTHFSEAKRGSAIERLAGDPVARARAEALRHLLPCRPAGPLALLRGEPTADLLFIGHHGFEGLSKLPSLRHGTLVGRTVRVRFWREPASSVPRGVGAEADAARLAWLGEQWQRMDDWLDALERAPG